MTWCMVDIIQVCEDQPVPISGRSVCDLSVWRDVTGLISLDQSVKPVCRLISKCDLFTLQQCSAHT